RRLVDRGAGLLRDFASRADPLLGLIFQIEAFVQVLRGAARRVAQLIEYAITHRNPSIVVSFMALMIAYAGNLIKVRDLHQRRRHGTAPKWLISLASITRSDLR